MHYLVYNSSSLVHKDSGEVIYKQRELSPKCIYFVTRGGVVETREEVREKTAVHKIGQLFGFENMIMADSLSTAKAVTFTELL